MRRNLSIAALSFSLAVWSILSIALGITRSGRLVGPYIGSTVILILALGGLVFYGDRQAEEDSGDTGPSASTQGTTYLPTIGTITTSFPTAHHYARKAIDPGLTVVEQDEPIKAYKAAWVKLDDDGKITIHPTVYGQIVYGVEAVAMCGAGRAHQAPNPICTCGFYAKKTRPEIESYYSQLLRGVSEPDYPNLIPAILEVELYGTVMEHEGGYKAEKLRVMKVLAKSVVQHYCQWTGVEKDKLGMTHPAVCHELATNKIDTGQYGRVYLCDEHINTSKIEQPKQLPIPNAETDWEWI